MIIINKIDNFLNEKNNLKLKSDDILINPTSAEMKNKFGTYPVHFILDSKNKKIVVWVLKPKSNLTLDFVKSKMVKEKVIHKQDKFLMIGSGDLIDGKIRVDFIDVDDVSDEDVRKLKNTDWSWAGNLFTGVKIESIARKLKPDIGYERKTLFDVK